MNPTRSELASLARRIAEAPDDEFLAVDTRTVGAAVLDLLADIPVTRHPLGFFHFEITRALDLPFRVRLHIWTEQSISERDERGSHHAHTWSLASCVLVGSLRDTAYKAVPNREGPFSEIEVLYPEDRLRPTGARHSLEIIRELDVSAGRVYRLDVGVPHNTVITSTPTATLVVAQESGLDRTSVYRLDADTEETSAERRPVPVDDAARVITEVLGA